MIFTSRNWKGCFTKFHLGRKCREEVQVWRIKMEKLIAEYFTAYTAFSIMEQLLGSALFKEEDNIHKLHHNLHT